MSVRAKDINVPAGFAWDHVAEVYKHPDGRWIDGNNGVMYDQTGKSMTVEQQITGSGKTAKRVTPADVEAAIKDKEFIVRGTLTICILKLQNDFTVTGESACASPENFDEAIGQRLALEDAKRKIWPLLGYALRTQLDDPYPNE